MYDIGIFDSGVGGLTVFREIKKQLPNCSLVYLGDNARNPYGSKSQEKIKEMSLQNAKFLSGFGVSAVVIACNTASAIAKESLEAQFSFPIFDVITGSAQPAVSATKNKKIGIIGTRQTIGSRAHEKAILSIDPNIEVFEKSTPLFAPIVEEGFRDRKSTQILVEEELLFFREKGVDTLVLGCTHYPLLKEVISEVLPNVTLIDPSVETAKSVKNAFQEKGEFTEQSKKEDTFFVTDTPVTFSKFSTDILGKEIIAERVSL